MSKKIYVDAVHPEETRVVVVDSATNRVSDFDVETTTKPQIKGNIYLAKVIRVEPSLQAAFVDYGTGKNGFLPFSEIHPDYYQVSPEQKKKLLELAHANIIDDDDDPDVLFVISWRTKTMFWLSKAKKHTMPPKCIFNRCMAARHANSWFSTRTPPFH